MARILTSKIETSGHRFLTRRIDQAITQRDSRMLHAPMNMQAIAASVGLVLSTFVVALGFFLAWLKPQTTIDKIRIGQSGGSLFVMFNGKLHPVFNLASARLILGSSDQPEILKPSELKIPSRGLPMGIPDAPNILDETTDPDSQFTVCYSPLSHSVNNNVSYGTTVIAGKLYQPREIGSHEAAVVQLPGRYQGQLWMIHDGHRSLIDMRDKGIAEALSINRAPIITVSAGFLNAIPQENPLLLPIITGKGSRALWNGKYVIGQIVQERLTDAVKFFLVTKFGLAPISKLVSDILLNKGSHIVDITPPEVVNSPYTRYDVSQFPETAPNFKSYGVLCSSWLLKAGVAQAVKKFYAGDSLPLTNQQQRQVIHFHPVRNTPNPIADNGYVTPGEGWYVVTTDSEAGTPVRTEAQWYISDTGIRYGLETYAATSSVNDSTAGHIASAEALGLHNLLPAPWQIISLLPPGTFLSRANALTEHELLPADFNQRVIIKQ